MWPFDPNKQQMYQQYAQASNTGDYSGIDPNEAQGQLQQFVQNAPPLEGRYFSYIHYTSEQGRGVLNIMELIEKSSHLR